MPTLQEIRVNKQISQKKLAELTGLTVQLISHMENGHAVRQLSFDLVCKALDIDASEVTGVVISKPVGRLGRKVRQNVPAVNE